MLLPLVIALPLLVATILMGLAPFIRRHIADGMAIVTTSGVTLIAALLTWQSSFESQVHWFSGWEPREGVAIGIAFVADPFGAGMGPW